MGRQMRLAAGAVAVALMTSGCFGSFNLTRKVYDFNKECSDDKWVRELAFLLMSWVQVYSIAGAADAIVFNSIEFWTGTNPLTMESAAAPSTRRIVRNNTEMIMSRRSTAAGPELVIEQLQGGELASTVRIQPRDGKLVASDEAGQTVFSAETLADGSVKVSDAEGQQLARYTADQAERFLKTVRQ